jgi:hypothetical protein
MLPGPKPGPVTVPVVPVPGGAAFECAGGAAECHAIRCGVLNYQSRRPKSGEEQGRQDSNPRHPDLEAGALTELSYTPECERGSGSGHEKAARSLAGVGGYAIG